MSDTLHESITRLLVPEQTAWFQNQLRFRVELLQEFLDKMTVQGLHKFQVAIVPGEAPAPAESLVDVCKELLEFARRHDQDLRNLKDRAGVTA